MSVTIFDLQFILNERNLVFTFFFILHYVGLRLWTVQL